MSGGKQRWPSVIADSFNVCFGKKRRVSAAGCFSGLGIRDMVGYDKQLGEVAMFCLHARGVTAGGVVCYVDLR